MSVHILSPNELYHHGILGQKWGKKNGPPYPLSGGDYSQSEITEIYKKHRARNSIYNKKHFDEVLNSRKTTLTTLSANPDRVKNTDMFYAAHDKFDKHEYNALFNKPMPRELFDENGNSIGTGIFLKYRINTKLKKDIKVASEDSAAKVFSQLYKNDRDFYNFVTDKNRMQSYFVQEKFGFKGYREARDILDRIRDGKQTSSDDLKKVYRIFNYTIPYDGAGNERNGRDAYNQRTKFFNACKKNGYGAVLDTNDAIYGKFEARSPVIVFDMDNVVPQEAMQTKMSEKRVSTIALVVRKMFKL